MNELIFLSIIYVVSVILFIGGVKEVYKLISDYIHTRPSKIKLCEGKAGFYTGIGRYEAY